MNNNAIVVFSGGQDSTTCLLWSLDKFDTIEAITFDYNQRHGKEIECAKFIAKDLNISHKVIDMKLLNQITMNALTRTNIDIEGGDNGDLPTTFVDGRNMIFLTFAAIIAKQKGIKNIITGVCETDFSGYPDCRNEFIKLLNNTLNLAMNYEFKIHTPLMWLTKEETWKMADELGYLYYIKNNTLTCYNGIIGDGCGNCPSCKLRNNGLQKYIKSKGEI